MIADPCSFLKTIFYFFSRLSVKRFSSASTVATVDVAFIVELARQLGKAEYIIFASDKLFSFGNYKTTNQGYVKNYLAITNLLLD